MRGHVAGRVLGAALLALVAGCGGDSPVAPDAAIDGRDAGADGSVLELRVGTGQGRVRTGDAHYGCPYTEGTRGAVSEVPFRVQLFTGQPVEMQRVCVFDAGIGSDCEHGCTAIDVAGPSARLSLAAGGWYDLCVTARDPSVLPLIAMQARAPLVSGNTLVRDTLNTIVIDGLIGALGATRVPGTAAIGGHVYDCDDAPVLGARLRILDAARAPLDDLVLGYFDGSGQAPSPDADTTAADGLFGVANVPTEGSGVTDVVVEAWGVLDPAVGLERLACERAAVMPDGFTELELTPRRRDYPTGHPCLVP